MNKFLRRPQVNQVKIVDEYWTPYLDIIRNKFLPETFDKFENAGYFEGFAFVKEGVKDKCRSLQFGDGLVFETIRGASDFLSIEYNAELDKRLDGYIELIKSAQDINPSGFISSYTTCMYPGKEWGENGGDIVIQHDLYNQGALAEAAVSHYLATKKTSLLEIAVKSANNICSYMGVYPKKNIIPGHALPEDAFIRLYRLFKEHPELNEFAKKHNVDANEYLRVVLFWLDNRGNRVNRDVSEKVTEFYFQDHLPFAQQLTAVGHSVRACLLYLGGVGATIETEREDYRKAINAQWENIANKKMHINGGVGTRHDIEGFDEDYDLPNDAYLETCAAISFAFFSGEMNLVEKHAKYFDCFERSLYNNILGAVSDDGSKFTYQNPLIMDGSFERKEWHHCPCCPPMLSKIHSSLGTYIYAYNKCEVFVNLYIGSTVKTDEFEINQINKEFYISTKGETKSLYFRIPEYADNFILLFNNKEIDYKVRNGYAVIDGCFSEKDQIKVEFQSVPRRVFANTKVQEDKGLVAIMCGAKLYCAEGRDNNGVVDFEIAKDPELKYVGQNIVGKKSDGGTFTLIPYHLWGNRRTENNTDNKMAVWFRQQDMLSVIELETKIGDKLYADY